MNTTTHSREDDSNYCDYNDPYIYIIMLFFLTCCFILFLLFNKTTAPRSRSTVDTQTHPMDYGTIVVQPDVSVMYANHEL